MKSLIPGLDNSISRISKQTKLIEDNIKRLKLGSRQIYKILKDSDVINIESRKRKRLIKLIMTNQFDFNKFIYKKIKLSEENCKDESPQNSSIECDNISYYLID